MLIGLPFYENNFAAHPFLPMRYLQHRTICLAFLLYFTDYMASAASHNFIFNWGLIAQGLSIVQATNLSYVHSVMIFATGMVFGLVMWKTRSYKWWIMAGVVIRMIGYGVMFRVRTANPSVAELFLVQLIQGLGAGIVETGAYVAATVNVPHKETAQMAALVVMIGMLGSSIGSAISGAIYTGTFREQLAIQLGDKATPELIEALFNSINLLVPDWGTPERIAINAAVSLMPVLRRELKLTRAQYNNVTSCVDPSFFLNHTVTNGLQILLHCCYGYHCPYLPNCVVPT